jgi:hypothetical protein
MNTLTQMLGRKRAEGLERPKVRFRNAWGQCGAPATAFGEPPGDEMEPPARHFPPSDQCRDVGVVPKIVLFTERPAECDHAALLHHEGVLRSMTSRDSILKVSGQVGIRYMCPKELIILVYLSRDGDRAGYREEISKHSFHDCEHCRRCQPGTWPFARGA